MGDDMLPCYGHFCVDDPRAFRPDPDGLLPDELERWAADCEAWDTQDIGKPRRGGPHIPLLNGEGRQVGHITVAHYGLGTNEAEADPNWRATLERLRAETKATP